MPLPKFTFTLNGKPVTYLEGSGMRYPAYSGAGEDVNNPNAISHAMKGPLPPGRYYIIDRQSGGRIGSARDKAHDYWTHTTNHDWFALYSFDTNSDTTFINNVKRGNFRLHPEGAQHLSEGCITLKSSSDFYGLRYRLKNTSLFCEIPGTRIRYYGTVLVN
jgi:hypothetical protein